MLREAEELMQEVSLRKTDILVLAGDLLDRGPDSVGVVDFLCTLKISGYGVVLVKGNHEEKHERFRNAYRRIGRLPKMKNADELKAITDQLNSDHIAFLDSARLFFRIPEHDSVVVHAGILPWMDEIPSEEQFNAMPGKKKAKWSQALRVRHVRGKDEQRLTLTFQASPPLEIDDEADPQSAIDALILERQRLSAVVNVSNVIKPKGEFIQLNRATEQDPFWADVYDGRFGHVYFGHEPFLDGIKHFPHATGLDTGAVFGGSLSAAILEPGSTPKFVSITSNRKITEISRDD